MSRPSGGRSDWPPESSPAAPARSQDSETLHPSEAPQGRGPCAYPVGSHIRRAAAGLLLAVTALLLAPMLAQAQTVPSTHSVTAEDRVVNDNEPLALSVADADGDEGADATVAFAVTLDRAATAAVTVDYATADGTATAGDDYTATSGTLTFAPGETAKTVSVPIIDDTVEDGGETFTLALSNASGAVLADAEATGTILDTESPATASGLPGAPQNLNVAISRQEAEKLFVSWEAPASDGGSQITGYKIQYKLSDEETFDHEVAVSSDLSALPHSVAQVNNGAGKEHTVRVVATNTAGDGPPSEEITATPLTLTGHLRAFIKKDIVERYGAAHPWLRKTWEHMNRPGFDLSVRSGVGAFTHVFVTCEFVDELWSCREGNVHVNPFHDTSVGVILHEMAHVYTLSNGLASNPGPLGVARVYFNRVNLGGNCRDFELYADILAKTVVPDYRSYWEHCNGDNGARTQEALAVVRSALRGEMPTWFGTTYGSSDPDLELFWSHVRDLPFERRAVVYHLRNAFGGYCNNRTATESAAGVGPVRNPWRDGGCVPQAPGNVAASGVVNGRLSVSWNAPGDDGGAPVEGYKIQWKSGSQDYDTSRRSSRQARLDDPNDRRHLLEGLDTGTEYTVRVVAYNKHGDGALTGEVSANASGVDGTAPTLTNATVVGSTLTLNWHEELDTTSVPATSAFTVNVNGTRRGISGIGIAGGVVTLTLATAAKTGDTLTVSYTPPSEAGAKTIRDVAQNNAAAFSARTVGNETVIEIEVVSIAITSDPGPDGVYTYGKGGGRTRETIEATVTFTENVTVTGTPELPVRMAIEVGVPSASLHVGYLFKKRPNLMYHSGSGTAWLTFRRVVEEGDSNPDGISVPAGDIIWLNGGTIRGGSGGDAVLTHEGLVAQPGHRVDGVRPTLAGVSRDHFDGLSAAGTGSAVVNGNTITLIYNKALDETEVPTPGYGFKVYVGGTGSVYLAGVDGGTAQTVSDIAVNGNKVTLTLAAPVAADAEVRVDYEVPYYRRSAAITDSVGNQARNFYSDVIDNVTIAAGAANVTALALASSPGADRAYAIGDAIDVRVTYSTSVTVDTTNGTPTLLGLRVGSAARTAAYSGGSGTAELTFRYTVAKDDADADGVSIVSEYIALNGGTIGTGSSGVAAARTHSGLAAQVGHLVDGERPTLSSASVNGTTLTLDWSEPLDTASVPATSRFPIYVNGRQRGNAVDTVAVSGSTVTLTLSSAVAFGDTVGVIYRAGTHADVTSVRDAVGNEAAPAGHQGFGRIGLMATNETPPAVSIAARTSPVTEGANAAFTLTRTGSVTAALTVTVEVTESGAVLAETSPAAVTFEAEWVTAALELATADDEAAEDASTVTATVVAGDGWTVDADSDSATVTVEDDDAAPEVTTDSALSVPENTTAVVTLAATDADTDAENLAWSIPVGTAGGADAEAFALTGAGVLAFKAAKDFEAPDDADRDGTYEVTVRITDGANPVDMALEVTLTDVDEIAPALAEASVNGTALTLTFSEALDATSKPAADAFAVTVAGDARTVDAVSLSGSAVELTLDSAVASGETVTVGYTAPTGSAASPLKDAAGIAVDSFTGEAVTNVTPEPENAAPTGLPEIAGTAKVGEALTASVDGIADADGLDGVTFAYRWIANDGTDDTEIEGAIGATHEVAPAEVGKTLKVRVTFTDGGGTEETLLSAATEVVAARAPGAPGGLAAATAEGREGELDVTWTAPESDGGADVTGYKVQWKSGAEAYDGTVSSSRQALVSDPTVLSHTITGLAVGTAYTVRVMAVNVAGDGAAAAAAATVWDWMAPVLMGRAVDGAVLTLTFSEALDQGSSPAPTAFAVTGAARTVAEVTLSGSAVALRLASAVASGEVVTVGYTVPADAGAARIKDAAGNAAAGFTGEAVTNATRPPNRAPTGLPVIDGTPREGEVLTASVDGIADEDGLDGVRFAYQWIAIDGTQDTEIAGATGESWTLTAAEVGRTVKVRVTFTDDNDNEETLESAPGEAVAALPVVFLGAATVFSKEGEHAVFTLRRTGDVSSALTVAVTVEASGAVLATPVPASAAFAAGVAEVELRVATVGDGEHALDGTITAGVAAGRGYRPAPGAASASVTVLDDDAAPLPPAAGAVVWSADMTVVDYQTGAIGAASADLFSNQSGSAGLRARSFWYYAPGRKLRLAFASGVDDADDLSLQAGELSLTFPEGSSANSSFSWTGVDVDWTDGETVAVRLAEAGTGEAPGDLSLGALSVTGATLEPAFDPEVLVYAAAVDAGTDEVSVAATANDGSATLAIEPETDADNAKPDHQVSVPYGETLIAVTVTSGTARRVYRVVASRSRAPVTVSFGAASYAAAEGGDAAEVSVTLSGDPGRAVTIPLSATPGGGTDAGDYAMPAGVIFAAGGALTQTVSVAAVADDEAETGEEVVLGFGALPRGIVAGATATATVTLADAAPENTAPTGLPEISGTAKVGEVLTASVDSIADDDGLEGVTFAYQWLANDGADDTEIAGATGTTHEVAPAEVGKTLKVRVTFTDDKGTEEVLVSVATEPVAARAPDAPGGLAAATAAGREGELDVSWTAPSSNGGSEVTGYKVQWKSGAEAYDGTASSTRQAVVNDPAILSHRIEGLTVGTTYTVRVLAVNDAGDGAAAEVEATAEDRVVPSLTAASVNGIALTLAFSEALDAASKPAAGAFAVTVAGDARTVTEVALSGSAVELTLASAVASGETVTVGYTVPTGANAAPLKDTAGNAAAGFTGEAVTNETAALPAVSIAAGGQSCDRGCGRGIHADADRVGLAGADDHGRGDGERRGAGGDVSFRRDLRGGVGHGGA